LRGQARRHARRPGLDGEHLLAPDRRAVRADRDRGPERAVRAARAGARDGMSRLAEAKRRLRQQSEHYLLVDSARRLGKGAPGTVKPYRGRDGLAWRLLFVPLYRRVPWAVKRTAMD